MLGLLVLVGSIGLADSLNPSTIVPAIYLATTARARIGLLSYTFGVFSVYALGGVLLLLGPGQLLLSALPHPSRTVKHALELAVGVVAVTVACVVWLTRVRLQERVPVARDTRPRAAFVLGAGIMVVELPTAFPYFAAVAAIVGSGYALPVQVGYLFVFNFLFVSPLLAIVCIQRFAGDRAMRMLDRFGGWLQRNSPAILALLLGVAGIIGIAVGVRGLTR